MSTIIIAAIDTAGCIGSKNKIPWAIKSEMDHFKNTTLENTVVMGTNTWKSFHPRLSLPKRVNVVLTRSEETRKLIQESGKDNLFAASSLAEVEEIHQRLNPTKNLYVIGGKQIYDLYLNSNAVDVALISTIPMVVADGDTFFSMDKLQSLTMTKTTTHDEFSITEYRK